MVKLLNMRLVSWQEHKEMMNQDQTLRTWLTKWVRKLIPEMRWCIWKTAIIVLVRCGIWWHLTFCDTAFRSYTHCFDELLYIVTALPVILIFSYRPLPVFSLRRRLHIGPSVHDVIILYTFYRRFLTILATQTRREQESPAIADKPARRNNPSSL